MELRPYQQDIVAAARGAMRGGAKSVLIQAPTGSGKTVLMAHMLREAAEKGKKSWMLVHRRELLDQTSATLSAMSVPHGVIASGNSRSTGTTRSAALHHAVQICSVQTLTRRLEKLPAPDLIVFDECHHVAASSWRKVYDRHPSAWKIGLTATPMRLDGQGLGKWFGHLIHGPSVSSLTEQGYLSPYRLYAPPSGPSLEGIKTRMGDWVRSDLAAATDKATITGDVIETYQRRAGGLPFIVFCVNVAHSKHVSEMFNERGISCVHVDGETPEDDRKRALDDFRAGRIKGLSGCELFSEGLDVPGIVCGVFLRATQSYSLFMQQVGRCLRPSDGKDSAILLDHVGNSSRHGLPHWPVEWDLDGRVGNKTKEVGGCLVRICPECFATGPRASKFCEACGAPFIPDDRDLREREGELVEIEQRNERQARVDFYTRGDRSMAAYAAEGKRRGYKHPWGWARFVTKSRKERQLFRNPESAEA